MSGVSTLPALRSEAGLSRYLKQIHRFPLLTADEEAIYARRLRDCGDREAAFRLVTSHLRLAAKIALTYRRYGLPVVDLISEASQLAPSTNATGVPFATAAATRSASQLVRRTQPCDSALEILSGEGVP